MTVEMLVSHLQPYQFIMIVVDDNGGLAWRGYSCEVPDSLLTRFILKLFVVDCEVQIICY